MSFSPKCPFCSEDLRYSDGAIGRLGKVETEWDHFFCDNTECMNDDMPRYQINYHKKSKGYNSPLSVAFMIGIYYVQVDYKDNVTILSKLEGPLLLDSVTIPKALVFDMSALQIVENRVKTLLLFS